jgi:hypothetical protein
MSHFNVCLLHFQPMAICFFHLEDKYPAHYDIYIYIYSNYLTCALLRVEYFFFLKKKVFIDFYDVFLYIKKSQTEFIKSSCIHLIK